MNNLPGAQEQYTVEWLKGLLRNVEGVTSVNLKNGRFLIESSRDTTSEIARRIVESHAGLNFLNKKEYGLDDIYYRYFEGGENNE